MNRTSDEFCGSLPEEISRGLVDLPGILCVFWCCGNRYLCGSLTNGARIECCCSVTTGRGERGRGGFPPPWIIRTKTLLYALLNVLHLGRSKENHAVDARGSSLLGVHSDSNMPGRPPCLVRVAEERERV